MIHEVEVRKLKLAAEAEEQKLAAETEERKFKLAAEERKLAAEAEKRRLAAEERKFAAEAEERKLATEAAERQAERKHKLEMEKLRSESERLNGQRSASSEDQQAAFSQTFQNAVAKTKAPVFPGFVDGKNNLDSYLLRFERYATVAGWE